MILKLTLHAFLPAQPDIAVRDWMFTHWWIRPLLNVWLQAYHGYISYSGTEHINWQKPLIFAPSHQNAFTDALCIILPTKYRANRFIYPLVRADAFGSSWALDRLLTTFHMMPVYRPRDDVNIRQRNEVVFSDCCEVLAKGCNLLIHPEGICIPKKRVGPLKKGLARIAFAAEQAQDFEMGAEIIPVGINYRAITEMRRGIHVRYGAPITIADYKDTYMQHQARAIRALTDTIKQSIEAVTVDVKSDEGYALAEDFFAMNEGFLGGGIYSDRELKLNINVARALDRHEAENSRRWRSLRINLQSLKEKIHGYNLLLRSPVPENIGLGKIIFTALALLLSAPVAGYGAVNNIIPWLGIHRVANRVQVKQFKSSARYVSGIILFPVFYLVQSLLFFGVTKSWTWTLLYLILLPITGYFALNWSEWWARWRRKYRWYKVPRGEKQTLNKLMHEI